MGELHKYRDAGEATKQSVEDLRSAPRFTLLIRSAKLICGTAEYLCVIRDVSASGIRLRIFHKLPTAQMFELELATGDRVKVERVWESFDHAGFRFADWIDVNGFIAEASPYRKRALRLRLAFPAVLDSAGSVAHATVRDLSREGARIETDMPLAIRQRVKLSAKGVPPLTGSVCWRSNSAYGLVFQQVFSFEELAKLAAQLQSTTSQPNVTPPAPAGQVLQRTPRRCA